MSRWLILSSLDKNKIVYDNQWYKSPPETNASDKPKLVHRTTINNEKNEYHISGYRRF